MACAAFDRDRLAPPRVVHHLEHIVSPLQDRSVEIRMLFDPEHNLEERVLKEQFAP
jgi:hypothetical protein